MFAFLGWNVARRCGTRGSYIIYYINNVCRGTVPFPDFL